MLSSFGYTEMLLLGIIALMLFGSKLPEVARNFGRGYREMRRKVDDLQREFRDWDKVEYTPSENKAPRPYQEDAANRYEPTAPKFVPPEDDSESS